jgi:WD40 repeat protein
MKAGGVMKNKLKIFICMCALVSNVYGMKKKLEESEKKIDIWSVKSPSTIIEPLQIVRERTKKITSFELSPDGTTLYSGSVDAKVDIWSIGSTKLEFKSSLDMQSPINSIALSEDGKTLFSAKNTAIIMTDLEQEKSSIFASADQNRNESFRKVFSRGREIISVGNFQYEQGMSGLIKSLNKETGKLEREFIIKHGDILSAALSPNKDLLVTEASNKTIALFDLNTFEILKSIERSDRITSFVFVPKKQKVIAATLSNGLIEWDFGQSQNKIKELVLFPLIHKNIWSLALGNYLAIGSVATAGSVANILLLGSNRTYLLKANVEDEEVTSMVFTNNGYLISGSDEGRIALWKIPRSEEELMKENLKKQAGEKPAFTDVIIKNKKE